jgi:CheY-like chemotaxis protein
VKEVVVLLVEDNESYALTLCVALEQTGIPYLVRVVGDGAEALAYLKGRGEFAARSKYPLPALMLLDLTMPGMDGLEVLRWMGKQRLFSAIRVVVLTASRNARDSSAAYKLGAHSYLTKPTDFDETKTMMATLLTPLAFPAASPELPPLPRSTEAEAASEE